MAKDYLSSWFSSKLTTSNGEGDRLKVSLNAELFDGNKALTVQGFAEKNSKAGTQYEAAFYNPAVPAGGSIYVAINVGALKMLVKEITIQFNGTLLAQTLFRGGSYTGGTAIPIYNMNDQSAVAHDVTIVGGVTPNLTGAVQVSPQIYTIGNDGQGNSQLTSIGTEAGVERVLWKESLYILRITNPTANPFAVAGLATWFYGNLSPENPIEV